jgi:hypothetical protein
LQKEKSAIVKKANKKENLFGDNFSFPGNMFYFFINPIQIYQ